MVAGQLGMKTPARRDAAVAKVSALGAVVGSLVVGGGYLAARHGGGMTGMQVFDGAARRYLLGAAAGGVAGLALGLSHADSTVMDDAANRGIAHAAAGAALLGVAGAALGMYKGWHGAPEGLSRNVWMLRGAAAVGSLGAIGGALTGFVPRHD